MSIQRVYLTVNKGRGREKTRVNSGVSGSESPHNNSSLHCEVHLLGLRLAMFIQQNDYVILNWIATLRVVL